MLETNLHWGLASLNLLGLDLGHDNSISERENLVNLDMVTEYGKGSKSTVFLS